LSAIARNQNVSNFIVIALLQELPVGRIAIVVHVITMMITQKRGKM
jgi:hypothetical protein